MIKDKTIRLCDLYGIEIKNYTEDKYKFYSEVIEIKQNKNITNRIKELLEYYKKRGTNKEEYILAYN